MKLIIAGSRDLYLDPDDVNFFIKYFEEMPEVTEVVSGNSGNVDLCGEDWAEVIFHNKPYTLPIKSFPADWNKQGKAAGPIRNKQMAEYADALLLIWDGESKGSANMKDNMLKLNKPVYEVILKKHNVGNYEETE